MTVVPEVGDGFVRPMDGPGLGTELLPDVLVEKISIGVALSCNRANWALP